LFTAGIVQVLTENEINMEMDKTTTNRLHENEDEQKHKSSRRENPIRSYGDI